MPDFPVDQRAVAVETQRLEGGQVQVGGHSGVPLRRGGWSVRRGRCRRPCAMVYAISATSSSVVTKGGPDLQRVVVDGADQHAGPGARLPTDSPGLITTSRLPD